MEYDRCWFVLSGNGYSHQHKAVDFSASQNTAISDEVKSISALNKKSFSTQRANHAKFQSDKNEQSIRQESPTAGVKLPTKKVLFSGSIHLVCGCQCLVCFHVRGQPSVEEIKPTDLFAPGVVLDVSMAAEADPDYRLTVADVTNWEQANGPIPRGAIVLLKTGWNRFWDSNVRYRNQDLQGKMHFPGFSAEAARWLVKERQIRGVGIDTLSIDHGPSKDFIVHHVINGAGRYGLENVAQLDKLPARNFFLIVAPIKITTGTGGPTRLFAVVPRNK